MEEMLALAARLVREGGLMAKEMIRHAEVRADKGRGDFVTEADLCVESHILDALRAAYPAHGFFSEECGGAETDTGFVWVLDPIDGTKHYMRGNPVYSVSLGLMRDGESVLGAVYLPETDQLYAARKNGGATLNGLPILCSSEDQLDQALVCAEIPSRHSPEVEQTSSLRRLEALIRSGQRVRIVGISSIGLCWCASGIFDVYVNLGSAWQPHDVAAAKIIMTEAGGGYTQHGQNVVAGPKGLCGQVETAFASLN